MRLDGCQKHAAPHSRPHRLRDAADAAKEYGLRPAMTIVDYAHTNAIDLIVIGSHGRSTTEKWWFGSVVQGVLLRAPCPVLVVQPHPSEHLI